MISFSTANYFGPIRNYRENEWLVPYRDSKKRYKRVKFLCFISDQVKLLDEMEEGKSLKNVTKTYLKRGNTSSDTESSSIKKHQRLNQLSNENSYVDQLLAFYRKSSDDQTSDQTHKLSYENMLLMNAIEELNKNAWNPKVITASTT